MQRARLITVLFAASAFFLAGALALLTANFTAVAIEKRAQRAIERIFLENGISYATVATNGLWVDLTGNAPTEAARFRAVSLAGRIVDSGRIRDQMDVAATAGMVAPRFSIELLRNDDGVSVIGLVPTAWEPDAALDKMARLASEGSVVDMLETADFAIPDGWVTAIDFGLRALELLPRSKISVASDQVVITAIADSIDEKQRFEAELARNQPQGMGVSISISAPRPVIAPFILRFVIDQDGARFDACSADTARAQARILAAAQRAGAQTGARCTLGLGVPSPRWADASIAVIEALAQLGAGVVTVSDVDVTLIAAETVPQEDFDRVIGELTTRLPDVFSLKASLTPKSDAGATEAEAQFTATLAPEGGVQLRGRLSDDRMKDMVEAFAKARFGAANVQMAARLDREVPANWGARVLAGLGALAELNSGTLVVLPERLALRGVTGDQGARQEISRQLSERLGQGAVFSVNVEYLERLDPTLGLPGPAECVDLSNAILARAKISFAPGASDITPEAARSLDGLAEVLKDCGGYAIEIGGHTDSQGRAETNLALSQDRAEAVLRGLSERNVPVESFTAKGYGASEPIADNGTEDGREANRRIAFRLLEAPTDSVAEVVETAAETDLSPAEVAGIAPDPETGAETAEEPTTSAEPAEAAAPPEPFVQPDPASLVWEDLAPPNATRPAQRPAER